MFELTSDDVVTITSTAGLTVDWHLSKEQAYSDKTRRRAYRPRVDAAVMKLSTEDRLRVSSVIASEMVCRHERAGEQLAERLLPVGWALVEGKLALQDAPLREVFLGGGHDHDAYTEIRRILHSAGESLFIVDPYVDTSLLTLVASVPCRPLSVKILTNRVPADFSVECSKFRDQHGDITLEVRRNTDFHDRFVVVDEKDCVHIGASIKDAGRRAFMISPIEDPANSAALISQQQTSWSTAESL